MMLFAEITAKEAEKINPYQVADLEKTLKKKGFKTKGIFRPRLIGKISYWFDSVKGSHHYMQEV
jgi:hypothetical protein